MFLCEKCHKDSGATCFHMAMSLGRCEDCGEIRSCADCKSKPARRNTYEKARFGDMFVYPKTGGREWTPSPVFRAFARKPWNPLGPDSLRESFPNAAAELYGRQILEALAIATSSKLPVFGAK